MNVLDQIEKIIQNKVKNENGNMITSYCHRNTKSFGNAYVLRINERETLIFESIGEITNWLNENGWVINTVKKS